MVRLPKLVVSLLWAFAALEICKIWQGVGRCSTIFILYFYFFRPSPDTGLWSMTIDGLVSVVSLAKSGYGRSWPCFSQGSLLRAQRHGR